MEYLFELISKYHVVESIRRISTIEVIFEA